METNERWLQWAVELQSIAQAGLYYGKDVFDRERYKRVREIAADLVIAVQDREKHNRPVYAYKVCKVFVLCSLLGGQFKANAETTDSGYFALDELPPLAEEKNTEEQVAMCFEAYRAEHWTTLFD